MKALSIQQPWAWLIVHGWKPVENRTWASHHRGPLLIHAGQRVDREGYDFVRAEFPHLLPLLPGPDVIERGGIVGRVRVVGCIPAGEAHRLSHAERRWFFGPYGLLLSEPYCLPFRPFRGQLGLFEVPDA